MNWDYWKDYLVYYYILKYGGLLLLLVWAFSKDPKSVNTIHNFNYPKEDQNQIRLMSLNMGFAGGMNNLDGAVHSRGKIKRNLLAISEKAKEHDINVLAVQEIDLNSRRSWFIDQVKFLAKECEFPYVAVAITWNKKWVPYPSTWKLWKHYGKTLAAQAIFSKHPIISQDILMFDKPKSRSHLYKLFYLDRLTQFVSLKLPNGETVSLGNLHLEAFDKDCRQKQSLILMDYICNNYKDKPLILAGDFNAIHPNAKEKGPFPDEPKIIHENDLTLKNIYKLGFLNDIFSEEVRKESEFNTFPCDTPNRQLDHIFYTKQFTSSSSKVDIFLPPFPSDHRSVISVFDLR